MIPLYKRWGVPPRGFRWCATVLQGCLIWGEHHGRTERRRLKYLYSYKPIIISISAAVVLAQTACFRVGS